MDVGLSDEEPLSAHEALALVEDQRHRVNGALQVNVALVHGALGLAGGLFFRDKVHYSLGAWLLITTAVSMFAGRPGNFAVLALAGGGGFLLATWRYATISGQAGG